MHSKIQENSWEGAQAYLQGIDVLLATRPDDVGEKHNISLAPEPLDDDGEGRVGVGDVGQTRDDGGEGHTCG